MSAQRWLITGASGQLGSHVVRQLATEGRGVAILALARQPNVGTEGVAVRQAELADLDALYAAVTEFKPTHVAHLGAMTAVGDCHRQPAVAERVNIEATRVLAVAAAGARFVFSSTDMVFDGEAAPYGEADLPRPLSHYGRTKAAAEQALADIPNTLVVRIPLLYGFPRSRRQTTFVQQIAALRAGQPLRLFSDEHRTPVWLADAARAVIGLARSGLSGVIHVSGPQRLSRYELLARCADLLGLPARHLVAVSRLDIAAAEPRPADLSLDGRRFAEAFPQLVPGPLHADALAGESYT